jgi:Co/Zn/Cd efflux system component
MNLRKTVLLVAFLNLIYFGVEFHFGRVFDSVALISDSIDFLEDASVNILIALAIAWSIRKREVVSKFLALLLLWPGMAFLWNVFHQISTPTTPEGRGMSVVASGALAVNLFCAILIARHRKEEGGLVMAAYYSARNDAIANVLIIAAGLVTLRSSNIWPDLIVGTIIFILNADAAREILRASKGDAQEHRA